MAKDNFPLAQTKYEASPLGRVSEQGAPGAAWQTSSGHDVAFTDRANTTNEVRQWTYDFNSDASTSPQTYDPCQLMVKETRDGQGGLVIEYIDKRSKLVLKKVSAAAGQPAADMLTYYVYDAFDNLRLVI